MSDASLKGRAIIITGGGRGLGRAMAEALIDAGADLMLTGAREADELEATRLALAGRDGGRCLAMLADVGDAAACDAVAAATEAAFGRIDVLFNNAARSGSSVHPGEGYPDHARFWEVDVDAYRDLVLTNFVGPFMMTRAVAPGMVARGFGRIINISTSRPTMLFAPGGPYGPAKAGLEASSRIWARQLEGSGVTVNVLLPGGAADTALIPGPGVGTRAAPWNPAEGPFVEGLHTGLLPPEVMVAPALWLASDLSDGVNGQRFVGRNWDPARPWAEAAAVARAATIDVPHII
ncbi:SDR family NAD(P)-dependent oxidoreductase [Polymorphobacter sp.]|uniref:SDR family NAD(P)-dependent oxidoreductase n=1 Tax=Polymorphobacter sp. TaxID=1909290 RepID=UPI003F71F7D6